VPNNCFQRRALHPSFPEGRLTRPTHWLDFAPFKMAHTPLKMTVADVHREVTQAWTDSYDPAATRRAMSKIADAPVPYKISHLIARLCFRGIYFPQKGSLAWFKVMIENRSVILRIIVESFTKWRGSAEAEVRLDFDTGARRPSSERRRESAVKAAATDAGLDAPIEHTFLASKFIYTGALDKYPTRLRRARPPSPSHRPT